ncbi:MAG TPA: hypothetical protein VNB06_13130, partial [Thermoanaerobaculia bacterium]|nr:hypothetical protein [Thermoanaerobaculia bacterium]
MNERDSRVGSGEREPAGAARKDSVGGLAGTLWQAGVAARERDAARQEAARASALNHFMAQMLTASDPE